MHTFIQRCICLCLIICLFSTFVFAEDKDIIDTSQSSEGYFTISYSDNNPVKMKVGVTFNNKVTYYDYTSGETSSYAFVQGDGTYTIKLYRNVQGSKYSCIFTKSVTVKLKNSLSPFLVSTKEITYTKDDDVSKKASEICKGLTETEAKIVTIHDYIHDNISYDYEFAADVNSGKIQSYTPKASDILSSHKGICYDFATLFAAMCRSQDIPCRIKKGYYRSIYHAWNEVYVNDTWYKVDIALPINKDSLKKTKKIT